MKKKVIMAAAIAFAVFAIPYGSNALSTVAVASENNTVASGNNTVAVESTESTESPFTAYCSEVVDEIETAQDNATVTITKDKEIKSLPNDFMKALYEKKTVTLVMEYTYEGKDYTVTIPAGKAENNDIPWYGPLYLQMRYGK